MMVLASGVRLVHAAYVVFLLGAPWWLIATWAFRRPALAPWPARATHLAALAFAGAQLVLGWACPLSQLENALAGRASDAAFLEVGEVPRLALLAAVGAFAVLCTVGHGLALRRCREAA